MTQAALELKATPQLKLFKEPASEAEAILNLTPGPLG
jgi:hypothetical protein